jgi:hypothetical protein
MMERKSYNKIFFGIGEIVREEKIKWFRIGFFLKYNDGLRYHRLIVVEIVDWLPFLWSLLSYAELKRKRGYCHIDSI